MAMTDTVEASVYVEQSYPDSMAEWPAKFQDVARQGIDRFLEKNPGLKIVSDRSYCISRGHDRWPADGVPEKFSSALVYEVRVDQPVNV